MREGGPTRAPGVWETDAHTHTHTHTCTHTHTHNHTLVPSRRWEMTMERRASSLARPPALRTQWQAPGVVVLVVVLVGVVGGWGRGWEGGPRVHRGAGWCVSLEYVWQRGPNGSVWQSGRVKRVVVVVVVMGEVGEVGGAVCNKLQAQV